MSDLVLQNLEGVPCVDTRIIAERLAIQHEYLIRNIKKYLKEFQILGILRFENGVIKGRGQPEKYVFLNEDQTVFALTLSRNTPQVVKLKLDLTIAFKKARQSQCPTSALPPFMQRAMLNRPALKDGYFSVIDQVSDKIIAGLEQLGATFPEKFCPDISVGLLWVKYLRDTNRNPVSVGAIKYIHLYQDGRQVDAWQYPEVMFSEFQTWLRSKWMVYSMPKYFNGKDRALMPLAHRGINKHFLPIPLLENTLLSN